MACPVRVQLVLQPGPIIESSCAIERVEIFAVGINDADIRERAQVAVHPAGVEIGAGVVFRISGRNRLSRASIIHAQDAHRPWTKFPCKAGAELRLNDIVGVVQADRRLEVAAVFDEERTHFGEVGRKALVGDRRIIDADLAEIGVDRGIENQAVVQNELRVQPAVALQMLVLKIRIDGVDRCLIGAGYDPKDKVPLEDSCRARYR